LRLTIAFSIVPDVRNVILSLLELQRLEMEVKRLSAADKETITGLRGKIPEPILGHYDRMRLRGKQAVSFVRHRVCSGCHMSVPIGTITVLMRGEDIQLCGNCGRYLLLEVTPPPSAEPTASEAKPGPKKRRKKSDAAEPAQGAPSATAASPSPAKKRGPRKARPRAPETPPPSPTEPPPEPPPPPPA
jgi:hypothetical protein